MNARDRRALLIGGVAIAGAVLMLRVLPWGVGAILAARADLRERASLLARGREELSRAPILRDSAAVLTRAVVALAPRLVTGGTPAEALADLSARLNLAAARAPARLERVDQLTDSGNAGRLGRVRVRATLETDVRGLAQVLKALELGDAALAIDRLDVSSPNPGSDDRAMELLRIEIVVSGWFLHTGDRPAKGDE